MSPLSAVSTPAIRRPEPTPIVWRNAVLVIFALSGLAVGSWLSRLPVVRDLLHTNDSGMSFLVFGLAAGAVVGLLSASHVIAHLGSRRTIRGALILVAAGLAVAGLGTGVFGDYAMTIAGLALFGLGNSVCDVAMNVEGAADERALGRTIMPVFHASFSGGTMIGAGVGAVAERWGAPLLVHMGVISAIVVAGLIGAVRYLPSGEPMAPAPDLTAGPSAELDAQLPPVGIGPGGAAEPRAAGAGWRSRLVIWRDPATLLIGLVVLGMAYAEGSAGDWLALAMVDGHGVSRSTGALVYGVFVTAMTAGRLLGGRFLDRHGRVAVLRVTGALAVFGLLVVVFVPSPAISVLGVVCWGLGASLGFPVGMSAAADDPARAAARVSAVATIGYLAFLVGPPVIGLLAGRVGLLHALLVVGAVVALATLAAPATHEPAPSSDHARAGKRVR